MTNLNCDNVATSRREDTNCTPKGIWPVLGYEKFWPKYPEATWVTRFQSYERGIALHYYPVVPEYPASHGCVRIAEERIAKLIYERTQKGTSIVVVQGELRPNIKIHGSFRKGNRGTEVKKLQKQLSDLGFQLAVDGDFGPSTEAIVKQFQQQHLSASDVDGIVGQITYSRIFSRNTVRVSANR